MAPVCAFPYCGRPVQAKFLCTGHYAQSRASDILKPLRMDIVRPGRTLGICSFDDCGRKEYFHGYCRTHYGQKRRNLELLPVGTRRRETSKLIPQSEALGRVHQWVPNWEPTEPYPGSNRRWEGRCVTCGEQVGLRLSNIEKGHYGHRCTRKTPVTPSPLRGYEPSDTVLFKYNITKEYFLLLAAEQGYSCGWCRVQVATKWVVDHDHDCCTEKASCGECVRGILCARCNTIEGYVRMGALEAGLDISRFMRLGEAYVLAG